MLRDGGDRGFYAVRFIGRLKHRDHDRGVLNPLHERGLAKGSVHRWHGLAAILTMMTLR